MVNGTILVNIHTADECAGQWCCIHSPSQHHMADWPHSWDDVDQTMWRACRHGIKHPDPDGLTFLRSRNRTHFAAHVCDGCCQPDMAPSPRPRKELNQ